MSQIYALCQISRQAHHQALLHQKDQEQREELYVRLMAQVRELHPGMGLRVMYDMCLPEGIGRDAFIALGMLNGFRLQVVRSYTRTTYAAKCHQYTNLLRGREFTDINQLWVSDITYVFCDGRFWYLVLIMDLYSRRILGHSLSADMTAERNYEALQLALKTRGIANFENGLIHHSDKGSQYASDLYTSTLDDRGILISMCDEVWENTHIERLNGTVKNQYLERMVIPTGADLGKAVKKVLHTYNHHRPHKSLGGIPPVAYEQKLLELPMEQRSVLTVYTTNKNKIVDDSLQLELDWDS